MAAKHRIGLALALAALLGVGLALLKRPPTLPPGVALLREAAYPDLTGRTQPLAQWHGQRLVVNFWASWCAPCREEMPDFDALARQYQGQNVQFVGIAIDTPANVRTFLDAHPVAYPILIGEGAALALMRALGHDTGALPYTVVVEPDGEISLAHLGRLERRTLDDHLAHKRP